MHAPSLALATAVDLEAVTALVGAQLDDHDVGLARSTLRGAVARLLEDASLGFILVASADGEAIGVAVVATTWTLEHGGLVGWLDELYVKPERRDAGIGAALLDAAMAEARSRSYVALELEVDEEHGRAERLYERAGFTRLTRRRFSVRLT